MTLNSFQLKSLNKMYKLYGFQIKIQFLVSTQTKIKIV